MSEAINNSAWRKEELKRLILDLHAGGDLAEIQARFREIVGTVSGVEVARMEQELIAEGLPAEEVKRLCDVHVAVFEQGLEADTTPEMTPGHPIHTFRYEAFAANEVLGLLGEAIDALPDEGAFARARAFADQLAELDKLYSRKENLLFPFLEKHGIGGPSKVMWGIHDDIRDRIKELREALRAGAAQHAREVYQTAAEMIRSMFYKEDHILFPTSLRVLSDAEWVAIRDQSDEIGYCLIRPGDKWQPQVEAAAIPGAPAYAAAEAAPVAGEVRFATGALTPEQLVLLFQNLPVDVTFVDENDTVRFYSESREGRIFVRTPAVVGRQVQNCHPPHSVHVVNRILEAFRAGTKDVAEFWIQMNERFIHIRYLAMRAEDGAYKGTLEVVQDLTHQRALAGERRLLDWA